MRRRGVPWFVIIVAGVVGILLLMQGPISEALADGSNLPRLVFLSIIAVPALAALAFKFRHRPLAQLRDAAIWLCIGAVLLVAYSFRDELGGRIMGELLPRRGVVAGDGSVTFSVGTDGHFHVEGLVDGARVGFLVDTGASEVVLTPADARRLGYDPGRLDYSRMTETANGIGRGAPILLREVSVGNVTLSDVTAMVNEAEMGESLLGMSFLSRLSGVEFSGDKLTLRR